ncbi:menaquinol oxidoreductase complex Cbc5, membrane protein subunit, putative [Citrifermentans bemidjiense Bem]|uniref:Menaquinol oxidoreductase complex Cbc5, membrane protein subunit, putative n=1 Tax=Citrifermentans bemidjiense (strain ATCC BAA-1014 / DSM 16622 / JCM 12645 / Bem) TaxID=404380 RepID=B5EDB9_CITBB|nr:hypothetical protein [Citrifermentans bemidjiense]ACH37705.1 menaquinol oxidoreductase complex Cbc5, membrane protein subunit, putative [Citrifermentans bemidjiense Bem]
MSGHVIEQIKTKPAAALDRSVESSIAANRCREELARNIDELHALSRRGLWGLLLFLGVSAAALYLSQMEACSLIQLQLKEIFGPPPPSDLLHVVLAVSWLSGFVLILGRRGADGKPGYNWCNIALPTAFYPLYVFSDAAGGYFPAVFCAGLVLLLLEHGFAVCYARKVIREANDRLSRLPL